MSRMKQDKKAQFFKRPIKHNRIMHVLRGSRGLKEENTGS